MDIHNSVYDRIYFKIYYSRKTTQICRKFFWDYRFTGNFANLPEHGISRKPVFAGGTDFKGASNIPGS